tara:strand:+ start:147 stop:1109 length:963 start_codon:yes stop_codon:yes gene_type:complete
MTYDILNGPELMNRLKDEIKKGGAVDLAVAFWGQAAMETLGLTEGHNVRLICNLTSGGTNPSEIRKLLVSGLDIKMHNKLHAKIGTVGTDLTFVGSSNFSANGLGYEDGELNGWEEANTVFSCQVPDVSTRFSVLWEEAAEITEDALKNAETAWRLRQRSKRATGFDGEDDLSFLEVLRSDPKRYEAHNAHVVVYKPLAPEDEPTIDQANEIAQSRYGSNFEVYWDWAALPSDAVLIDFRKPARGVLAFEGLYRRHPDFGDFEEDGENFQPAYQIDSIGGVRLGNDKYDLKKAVTAYMAANPADEDDAYCFPISALREFL